MDLEKGLIFYVSIDYNLESPDVTVKDEATIKEDEATSEADLIRQRRLAHYSNIIRTTPTNQEEKSASEN